MIWLWVLLGTWAVVLALFVLTIAYSETRHWWRQRRRRNVQTVDFTRKRVG